jgi:hypothetical protein
VYIPAYRLYNDEYLPITEIGRNNDSNGVFSSRPFITKIHIPDTVKSINGGAFYGCTSLTSITIPKSVTQISNIFYVLRSCTNLTSISVDDENPIYASDGCILYNKTKTELIKAMEGISGDITISEGVMSISVYAFDGCKNITSILIPTTITSLGYGSFRDCTGISSVIIPEGVLSIEYTFPDCTNLTNISIPSSLTSIGDGTFNYCNSIASITVGNNLVNVGYNNGTRLSSFWNYYQTITAGQRSGTYTWNGIAWSK